MASNPNYEITDSEAERLKQYFNVDEQFIRFLDKNINPEMNLQDIGIAIQGELLLHTNEIAQVDTFINFLNSFTYLEGVGRIGVKLLEQYKEVYGIGEQLPDELQVGLEYYEEEPSILEQAQPEEYEKVQEAKQLIEVEGAIVVKTKGKSGKYYEQVKLKYSEKEQEFLASRPNLKGTQLKQEYVKKFGVNRSFISLLIKRKRILTKRGEY